MLRKLRAAWLPYVTSGRFWALVLTVSVISGLVLVGPNPQEPSAVRPAQQRVLPLVPPGQSRLLPPPEQITDEDLEKLPEEARLTWLELSGSKVTDRGLRSLVRFRELAALSLSDTRVTDAGLEYVAQLARLSSLELARTGVTDSGLKRLRSLNRLVRLDLSETNVTDRGLKHLATLKNLQFLALTGTHISDSGLGVLAKMPNLRRLVLLDTDVTPSGLRSLQQARPDLQLVPSADQLASQLWWRRRSPSRAPQLATALAFLAAGMFAAAVVDKLVWQFNVPWAWLLPGFCWAHLAVAGFLILVGTVVFPTVFAWRFSTSALWLVSVALFVAGVIVWVVWKSRPVLVVVVLWSLALLAVVGTGQLWAGNLSDWSAVAVPLFLASSAILFVSTVRSLLPGRREQLAGLAERWELTWTTPGSKADVQARWAQSERPIWLQRAFDRRLDRLPESAATTFFTRLQLWRLRQPVPPVASAAWGLLLATVLLLGGCVLGQLGFGAAYGLLAALLFLAGAAGRNWAYAVTQFPHEYLRPVGGRGSVWESLLACLWDLFQVAFLVLVPTAVGVVAAATAVGLDAAPVAWQLTALLALALAALLCHFAVVLGLSLFSPRRFFLVFGLLFAVSSLVLLVAFLAALGALPGVSPSHNAWVFHAAAWLFLAGVAGTCAAGWAWSRKELWW